jgi:hypothetical protein
LQNHRRWSEEGFQLRGDFADSLVFFPALVKRRRALVYLGCNGRGVALATAMGLQLARRLIEGEAVEIDLPITTLKPIRFHAIVARGGEERRALWRDRVGL